MLSWTDYSEFSGSENFTWMPPCQFQQYNDPHQGDFLVLVTISL
jgi:hypothetical protein